VLLHDPFADAFGTASARGRTGATPVRHPKAAATPAGRSVVARARVRRVAVFAARGAKRPKRVLRSPNAYGVPRVFLVVQEGPRRLRVLLPTRPNLSTGWIARRDVKLQVTPYRLVVSLRAHRMAVIHRDRFLRHVSIAVGRRAVSPTPTGRYFITELLRQPDPRGAYGPYAFGLSGHSAVLDEFAGGDGQIGIHGTNQPSSIGRDVSHGCIRVRNDVIRRLARRLPLGTPVEIRA
jgi:lipoprotein-anchoring transpeptidase ErfK/SrfK